MKIEIKYAEKKKNWIKPAISLLSMKLTESQKLVNSDGPSSLAIS